MLIVPIRHHSPAGALQVERLIRARRPRAVLIEGPLDADPLIPLLLDAATVPPVALYAYRADLADDPTGPSSTAFYPFCHYSPEYAALRAGQAVGAALHFCDVPTRLVLNDDPLPPTPTPASRGWGSAPPSPPLSCEAGEGSGERVVRRLDLNTHLARSAGFDDFDAYWEAAFEQGCGGAPFDDYLAAFAAYGGAVRAFLGAGRDRERDDPRERQMAAVALRLVADGVAPDEIVLICGAAHAEAITSYFQAGVAAPEMGEGVATEIALVPYSYPRLSEQLGYGAGNRAPWFYQQVWRLGGDYRAATRHALVTLAHALREQGQIASLAQGIDANELATLLAGLRGKPQPGVDELTDAAIACFGQGQPAIVDETLRGVLIGQELGQVTPRAGRTPLQTEFYATARRLRLPVIDATRQILVHLPVPEEAAQSLFLHRLVAAEVPFANELASGLGGRGKTAQGGPLAGLGRSREKWELCWTPLTDARLVEQNAWGSTLAEVCERLLRRRLVGAGRIDEGTAVLLRLALCDLPDAFSEALVRCETLAADSASFAGLARAAFHLDGLLSLGAVRRLPLDHLADLASRLFVRATLHLPAAVACADEAADEVEQTLIPLAELVRKESPTAAPALFWDAIERVAGMESSHPALRGLCLTLLEVHGRLGPGELARRLRLICSGGDAAANARLIAGVFALHRGTLVRNRTLIAAVTEFLVALDIDALIPLLPALRRSLGGLSPAERAYLSDTLTATLGLASGASLRFAVSDVERGVLAEVDAKVAGILTEWGERYGIR